MKKILIVAFVALFSLLCYSQSNYKKGKIVKNDGVEVECYIINRDWNYSPTSISYKINENDNQDLEGDLTTIKSFEIFDICKYVRLQLKIDNSSDKIIDYTFNREPDYLEKTIFAKEIVNGNLSLYEYYTENYLRFIVQTENGAVEQLTHKFYKITKDNDSSGRAFTANTDYRKQLGRLLKCPTLDFSALQTLKYTEHDLKKIILINNVCLDPTYAPTKRKDSKGDFNLNILAKANNTSFELNEFGIGTYDFPSHLGFGAGLEFEYIFAKGNKRWAVIAECSYNQVKTKTEKPISQFNTDIVDVTYNNLDISLGARFYAFNKKDLKIYMNVSTFFNTPIGQSFINRSLFVDLELVNGRANNYSVGLGTKVFNRFIFDCRYHFYGQVPLFSGTTSQSTALSLSLGYSFL